MTYSQETIEKGDTLIEELFNQLRQMARLLEPLESNLHYTPWMNAIDPSQFIANLDDVESEIIHFSCDYLDALIAFDDPTFNPDEAIQQIQNEENNLPDEARTPEYLLNSLKEKDLSLIAAEARNRISEAQDESFRFFLNGMLSDWNLKEELQHLYEDGVKLHDHAVPEEMTKMAGLPFPIPAIIDGFLEAWSQHHIKANDIFFQLKSLKNYPFVI